MGAVTHSTQAHINFSHKSSRSRVLLSSLKIVTNVFPQQIEVFHSVFETEIVQHTTFCFTFAHALFKCACKRICTLDYILRLLTKYFLVEGTITYI